MIGWILRALGRAPGPRVRTVGRGGLEYTDGDRRMRIEAEMLIGGPHTWAVYTDSIRRWDPPFHDEPVTPQAKQRIIDTIVAKFGTRADLVERPVIDFWVPEGATVMYLDGRMGVTLPPDPPAGGAA